MELILFMQEKNFYIDLWRSGKDNLSDMQNKKKKKKRLDL